MEKAIGRRFARSAGILILALISEAALAAAGTVVFVSGEATLDRGAATIPIEKDLAVESGDLLATGYDGRVQVRMADGQWISLFPNTRFRIDEFALGEAEAAGTDATMRKVTRSLYSLLRGGFRTITSSVGRVAPSSYRVRTPVATLGIRGTTYSAVLDNGLYLGTEQGAVSAANEAGSSVVKQGQYAYIKDSRTPAQYLNRSPQQLAEGGVEEPGTATESTATAAETAQGDFWSEPLLPILGAIGLAVILSSGSDDDGDSGGPSGTTP